MALLSLKHVTKRFDGMTAVDDVSFDVDRGQVVGFLGPNGAGKSTTMRMITQFFEPDGGEIRLDGVPLAERRPRGQAPHRVPARRTIRCTREMLVSEYLDFVARLRDLAARSGPRDRRRGRRPPRVESVFHRPIGELSKGFRQRVGSRRPSCTVPTCSCSTSRLRGSTPTSASRSAV